MTKFGRVMALVALLANASQVFAVAEADVAPSAAAPIEEYRLPPDKLEKSQALYRTAMTMNLFGTVYGIVVLVLAACERPVS